MVPAGFGEICHPRHRRIEGPLPQIGELISGAGVPARRDGWCSYMANGRVAVNTAPRADGGMTAERAGTERPDRWVETLAPTERLMRGRGTARVRTPGCACSVARRDGSEGCARCAARATAPSPRGKRKPPRSGMKGAGRAPAWQNKGRHVVTNAKPSLGWIEYASAGFRGGIKGTISRSRHVWFD